MSGLNSDDLNGRASGSGPPIETTARGAVAARTECVTAAIGVTAAGTRSDGRQTAALAWASAPSSAVRSIMEIAMSTAQALDVVWMGRCPTLMRGVSADLVDTGQPVQPPHQRGVGECSHSEHVARGQQRRWNSPPEPIRLCSTRPDVRARIQ